MARPRTNITLRYILKGNLCRWQGRVSPVGQGRQVELI